MFKILLSIFISACFSACCPTSSLGQEKQPVSLHEQGKKQGKYPVFIVTDRQVNETKRGLEFSYQRASKARYATFQVSATASDKLNLADVNLLESKEEFLSALKQTGASRIAVFVHGYRKSFEGSLEFAQRISCEVDIPVVLFAWPSRNKYSAYMIDECTAEWSSHQLAETFKDLGEQFGNENICAISHSLGARMVTWSFRILASQNQLKDPFACNLLFSPDMDRDTFLRESAFLNRCASVMKIYLDAHDTRIWLSRMLHGSPRVGTSDGSGDNETLQKTCQFNTSMPNHHIPFTILNGALNHLAGVETVDN
jgi:esterase/lipase superfamily enzyme